VKRSSKTTAEGFWSKSAQIAIVSFFMFGGIGAAFLAGRHGVDALTLQTSRTTTKVGDIVYNLPDGINCRYMTFNNETAAFTEPVVKPCSSATGSNGPSH
jgi:hypothetical protein